MTAWYYATPDGRLPVYFVADLATATAPVVKRGAAPPAPVRRMPGEIASCNGIRAIAGLKALVVHMPNAPAFIEPRLRAVPLTTLPAGQKLEVTAVDGAWYLVRFKDERWGTRVGYVHCSDVRLPEP